VNPSGVGVPRRVYFSELIGKESPVGNDFDFVGSIHIFPCGVVIG
jgi:hypothetical protein